MKDRWSLHDILVDMEFLWFIVPSAFFLSLFLTRYLIHYAVRRALIDHPNERSSHAVPTPRGGGLAIVLVSVPGWLALSVLQDVQTLWQWTGFLVPVLLVILISYLDDHRHIAARWRFLVHLLASVIAVFFFTGIPLLPMPGFVLESPWLMGGGMVLLLVWLLNLFNFMDGTDGIASVEALFLVSALLALTAFEGDGVPAFTLFNLLLIAAVSGFLFWNWPSAKIFMGDVGSSFLGFVLAIFGIYASVRGWINLWTLLILFGVFFVDATYTLLKRISRGDRWYEAHCSHAYQKIARCLIGKYEKSVGPEKARKKSHRQICYGVTFINMFWLMPLAWLSVQRSDLGLWLWLVSALPLVILARWAKAGTND